jgi:hypothetical protein
MELPSENNRLGHRIRTPKQWIEQHLEQMAPHLSTKAVQQIKDKLNSLPDLDSVFLEQAIDITYFPDGLVELAKPTGLDGIRLLDSIKADFVNGVIIRSGLTTKEGLPKAEIIGARWYTVVRHQEGKHSGRALAVLEHVRPRIPTGQPAFRPKSVLFHSIKDEVVCDIKKLVGSYKECHQTRQNRLDTQNEIERQLRELHEQRGLAYARIRRELRKDIGDAAVEERAALRRNVRRQYSALEAMMELLRRRTDHEQHSFPGRIISADDFRRCVNDHTPISHGHDEGESVNLHICFASLSARELIEEDSLVAIRAADAGRAKRVRVLTTINRGTDLWVELDLPSKDYNIGDTVTVDVISRFNMWANQKSVEILRDEQVAGYWPDLAKVLCNCNDLDVPSVVGSPDLSFCDLGTGGPSLNSEQRAAVAGAVATPHLFCIQGPPGTGKTTVICEIIQHLIRRGERILLAAPTHVAVDEVLRRIGSCDGVRALRLSWDDGRIAEEVRKFAPSQIIDPFIERAKQRDPGTINRFQEEEKEIQVAIQLLEDLHQCQQEAASAEVLKKKTESKEQQSLSLLAGEEPTLTHRLPLVNQEIQTTEEGIKIQYNSVQEKKALLREAVERAGLGGQVLGWLGMGTVGEKRGQLKSAEDRLMSTEARLVSLNQEKMEKEARLQCLRRDASAAQEEMSQVMTVWQQANTKLARFNAACLAHHLLQPGDLVPGGVGPRREKLADRCKRIGIYQDLRHRFDELVAEATRDGVDLEQLRNDLLAVSNLFCCTTTGIAGCQELRDVTVDTFIVDEASRVTDSEFLIGAVRARRWILVGDEHQLPPYVEQRDEHFIHALSALYLHEQKPMALDAAVNELGAMWEEDEELHRFRRQSVARIASQLIESTDWALKYREAFDQEIGYIRGEIGDPTRALLQSMRLNLVRSLFERTVAVCPKSLCVRLVEQRRMIAPIAEIVRDPIYDGNFRTPSEENLIACGITPLTTPSFPTPITFLDTSILDNRAKDELRGNSFINRMEARLIVDACLTLDHELAQGGSGSVTVSILAFYRAQARLIRDLLFHHEHRKHHFACLRFSLIDAIDRIQGQESDVVFLSFCRTFTRGKAVAPHFAQWLQDFRRLNVACTRAHRALIFVGQKDLLTQLCSNESAMQFYRHLNHLFDQHPEVMQVVRQFKRSDS